MPFKVEILSPMFSMGCSVEDAHLFFLLWMIRMALCCSIWGDLLSFGFSATEVGRVDEVGFPSRWLASLFGMLGVIPSVSFDRLFPNLGELFLGSSRSISEIATSWTD